MLQRQAPKSSSYGFIRCDGGSRRICMEFGSILIMRAISGTFPYRPPIGILQTQREKFFSLFSRSDVHFVPYALALYILVGLLQTRFMKRIPFMLCSESSRACVRLKDTQCAPVQNLCVKGMRC